MVSPPDGLLSAPSESASPAPRWADQVDDDEEMDANSVETASTPGAINNCPSEKLSENGSAAGYRNRNTAGESSSNSRNNNFDNFRRENSYSKPTRKQKDNLQEIWGAPSEAFSSRQSSASLMKFHSAQSHRSSKQESFSRVSKRGGVTSFESIKSSSDTPQAGTHSVTLKQMLGGLEAPTRNAAIFGSGKPRDETEVPTSPPLPPNPLPPNPLPPNPLPKPTEEVVFPFPSVKIIQNSCWRKNDDNSSAAFQPPPAPETKIEPIPDFSKSKNLDNASVEPSPPVVVSAHRKCLRIQNQPLIPGQTTLKSQQVTTELVLPKTEPIPTETPKPSVIPSGPSKFSSARKVAEEPSSPSLNKSSASQQQNNPSVPKPPSKKQSLQRKEKITMKKEVPSIPAVVAKAAPIVKQVSTSNRYQALDDCED